MEVTQGLIPTISRRAFAANLPSGGVLWALAAGAQPSGKVWRIGLFHVGLDHVPPSLEGLKDGLAKLGYQEGKNLRLDFRNLADEEAARVTAQQFVRDRVDLIVAFESQCVRAAQTATREIPIFFLHVTDPVAEHYVTSLAHPGGNLTGFGEFFGELHAKRVEILKSLIPGLRRLLVLVEANDAAAQEVLAEVRRAATALKMELLERRVKDQHDIDSVFESLKPGEVQAGFIASSTLITKFPSLILRLATGRRLAVPFHRKEWVEQGALFSYGSNFHAIGQNAATYVDKLLKGTKPADIPVERLTKVEFVINAKAAKALGLTIPPSLLLRADQVIE